MTASSVQTELWSVGPAVKRCLPYHVKANISHYGALHSRSRLSGLLQTRCDASRCWYTCEGLPVARCGWSTGRVASILHTVPVVQSTARIMVTCGICHEENLNEIGELDSCDHGYDCMRCRSVQHQEKRVLSLSSGVLQLLFCMHPAVGSNRVQMPIL